MTLARRAMLGAVLLALGVAGWLWFARKAPEHAATDAAGSKEAVADPNGRQPTLYCEFTNFADREPLVGFYFLIEEAKAPPAYALIFQREKDGEQANYEEGAARPEWRYDESESPAVLHAPDDTTAINLYAYDPKKPGGSWFEAGLRSIRYRNLGGRCRRSAA